jgi:hypothetical protein
MCSESSEYEDTEFEDDFDDDIETSEETEN